MKSILSLALAVLVSLNVQAKEVGSVDLKPTLQENGKTLYLNGAGIRSKYLIDVYVGSLYTTKKETSAESVLDGKEMAAIRLDIITKFISSNRMKSAVEEGFQKATGDHLAPLQERINAFMEVFTKSEINKGESFTLVGEPGTGVTAYRNGKKVTQVKGDDFRKALFSIWLGDKPVDTDLKKAMLKG